MSAEGPGSILGLSMYWPPFGPIKEKLKKMMLLYGYALLNDIHTNTECIYDDPSSIYCRGVMFLAGGPTSCCVGQEK